MSPRGSTDPINVDINIIALCRTLFPSMLFMRFAKPACAWPPNEPPERWRAVLIARFNISGLQTVSSH